MVQIQVADLHLEIQPKKRFSFLVTLYLDKLFVFDIFGPETVFFSCGNMSQRAFRSYYRKKDFHFNKKKFNTRSDLENML